MIHGVLRDVGPESDTVGIPSDIAGSCIEIIRSPFAGHPFLGASNLALQRVPLLATELVGKDTFNMEVAVQSVCMLAALVGWESLVAIGA